MADKTWIEQVVEKAVQDALDGHVPQLRNDLVRRVLEEVQPQLAPSPESTPASLLKAISAIQTGTTQREILRSLLDHAARYSGRAALFVIKAGAATGWQGRGFSNQDDIKDFALDVNSGIGRPHFAVAYSFCRQRFRDGQAFRQSIRGATGWPCADAATIAKGESRGARLCRLWG